MREALDPAHGRASEESIREDSASPAGNGAWESFPREPVHGNGLPTRLTDFLDDLSGKDLNQRTATRQIRPPVEPDTTGKSHRKARLFLKLPNRGDFGGLAGLDLATRQAPETEILAFLEKHSAFGVGDDDLNTIGRTLWEESLLWETRHPPSIHKQPTEDTIKKEVCTGLARLALQPQRVHTWEEALG